MIAGGQGAGGEEFNDSLIYNTMTEELSNGPTLPYEINTGKIYTVQCLPNLTNCSRQNQSFAKPRNLLNPNSLNSANTVQ